MMDEKLTTILCSHHVVPHKGLHCYVWFLSNFKNTSISKLADLDQMQLAVYDQGPSMFD